MRKEQLYKDFLVRELNIDQFLTYLDMVQNTDAASQKKGNLFMLANSLCNAETKEPIGDEGVEEIGASEFLPIWEVVKELNGMSEKKTDE